MTLTLLIAVVLPLSAAPLLDHGAPYFRPLVSIDAVVRQVPTCKARLRARRSCRLDARHASRLRRPKGFDSFTLTLRPDERGSYLAESRVVGRFVDASIDEYRRFSVHATRLVVKLSKLYGAPRTVVGLKPWPAARPGQRDTVVLYSVSWRPRMWWTSLTLTLTEGHHRVLELTVRSVKPRRIRHRKRKTR